MIGVDIPAHSVSPQGIKLLTFKLRYPWFIHGELMTHRVFSRNASSNRAIPLAKMLEEARRDDLRAEPVFWGAEQRGMTPWGEVKHPWAAKIDWANAAEAACRYAERLAAEGVHKSLCNRLLMPFTHANVVVTATEWDNFFGLRLHVDADPTMRALAVAMWEARAASVPVPLAPGQWHLPFVGCAFEHRLLRHTENERIQRFYSKEDGFLDQDVAIKVSVARCARVSYESFETDKRSTVEEDLRLYDKLVGAQPLHASPAEHQATPDEIYPNYNQHKWSGGSWANAHQHGNFIGWRQYRQMLPGQAVAPLPKEFTR